MGKISDYVNEKYVLVSGLGSGILGAGVGTAIVTTGGGLFGLTGIAAGGAAFVLANLFRYRSQDEVNEILNIEPMDLKEGTNGTAQIEKPRTEKEMRIHFSRIMRKVLEAKDSLGEDIINAAVPIFENINEIQQRWDRLEGMAEVEYTVEAIIYDYLPTSLEAYTNVSKHERAVNDASLKAELIEQLNILAAETKRIRDNLYDADVKPLMSQTHFLKARFGSSELPQLSLPGNNVSE